jgi:KDO2-lipid IV(A) lauroyltransferase
MATGTRRRAPGFFGGEARSDSSDIPVSTLRFLGPRYWRGWLLIGWLKLTAIVPWRISLGLHQRLGRWLGTKSRKSARIVDDNLTRCFPELSRAERARLASDYFANMGAIVAELAIAWFGSPAKVRSLLSVEGSEHIARALTRGKGVILYTGHFTPIEICVLGIREHAPRYALLYNKRRSRLLSEYQRRSRARIADESIPKHDIRGLLRCLRENSVVWFAGDEAHTGKSSALIPFFGEPALTNTSLSRIARISSAAVVPVFFCRKSDDSGYLIRCSPALEGFPSDDAIADTKLLVALLEAQIRECPEQYFWKQRRFRRRRGDARERPQDS